MLLNSISSKNKIQKYKKKIQKKKKKSVQELNKKSQERLKQHLSTMSFGDDDIYTNIW